MHRYYGYQYDQYIYFTTNSSMMQACTWANKGDGLPLLVLAGKRGIVKVLNTIDLSVEVAFVGHGNEVLDVTTHTVDDNIIFSSSKDESVRMWNIKTRVCISIFGGEQGHRNEVLSVAVHPAGNIVASSGMDHSIKLWNLVSPDIQAAIEKSYTHDDQAANIDFVTHLDQLPIFSTDKVHRNYVDCVKWVGDLILSKSICNRAALWTPDPLRSKDAVCVLREFSLTNCRVWFMKMAVCDLHYIFAVGSTEGEVQLFHFTPPSDDEDIQVAANNFLPEIRRTNENIEHERYETGCINKPNATISHESGVASSIRDLDFDIDGEYLICCAGTSRPEQHYSKICVWRIDHVATHWPSQPRGDADESL